MILTIHSREACPEIMDYPERKYAEKAVKDQAEQTLEHYKADNDNKGLLQTMGRDKDGNLHIWTIFEKGPGAILVWSNGIEMNYVPFKTEQEAIDHMHEEYDDHVASYNKDDLECCERGDNRCYAQAHDDDACVWTVIPLYGM